MDQYKAVITEPNRKPPEPDKYGTLTIPPSGSCSSVSLVTLRDWARKVLPGRTEGAYVTFYRIEEEEIERLTREEACAAAHVTRSYK